MQIGRPTDIGGLVFNNSSYYKSKLSSVSNWANSCDDIFYIYPGLGIECRGFRDTGTNIR